MAAIRTIVVPTDCGEASRRALRYADAIASRAGASIVAVYGAPFSSRMEGVGLAGSSACADDREQLMLPIRRCVEEALDASLAPSTSRFVVVADNTPARAVVDVADERDADLIVMGTRERNRLVRAVLGSITESVLHDSNRPVLLLREQGYEMPMRRIICPFKSTPQSIAAVGEARRLADIFGAELLLLRVIDEAGTAPVPEQIAAAANGARLEELRLDADPGPQVVALAAARNSDLIVLPAQHRRFSDPSVVGTPSSHIVRMARCPVLTVTAPTRS